MIQAKDYSYLRGQLIGISDRALDAHLQLYRGYVEALNAIEKEYPLLDWTRPVEGQAAPPAGISLLLDTPIAALKLQPEGALKGILADQAQELLAAGIKWAPSFYLGEGAFWTADQATSVNLPWYLANPALWWLVNDRKAKYTEEEVERAVRHEVGHALNYAFEIWKRSDWQVQFGAFESPYLDVYTADPRSEDFVKYLHRTGDKHYAQKHPDEDWAETFATWLDPRSHWRDTYPGGGARRKLEYIEGLVQEGALAGEPTNRAPGLRVPYQGLQGTVGQFLGAALPGASWAPHSELLRREPYAWNAVVLHEIFFECLNGTGLPSTPGVLLTSAATQAFGSLDNWLTDLRAACGSTASGWALVCWDKRRERLMNVLVEDHRTGPLVGCPVIMAIDCWEHAAMDYLPRRDPYFAAYFQNVDWAIVEARLSMAGPMFATTIIGGEIVNAM